MSRGLLSADYAEIRCSMPQYQQKNWLVQLQCHLLCINRWSHASDIKTIKRAPKGAYISPVVTFKGSKMWCSLWRSQPFLNLCGPYKKQPRNILSYPTSSKLQLIPNRKSFFFSNRDTSLGTKGLTMDGWMSASLIMQCTFSVQYVIG